MHDNYSQSHQLVHINTTNSMADKSRQDSSQNNEMAVLADEPMIGSQAVEDQEEEDEDEVNLDFIPPSVHKEALFRGSSFDHYSEVPESIQAGEECVMGIDEAGRGPVLGKLSDVYGQVNDV
jgi:hypothetical protein